MFDRSRKGEHALLIQPHAGGPPADGALEEFTDLARSAGASIATVLTARIERPNPATLIGSGKLEEVKAAADATGADLVLVNHALSPVQERNLEKALEQLLEVALLHRRQRVIDQHEIGAGRIAGGLHFLDLALADQRRRIRLVDARIEQGRDARAGGARELGEFLDDALVRRAAGVRLDQQCGFALAGSVKQERSCLAVHSVSSLPCSSPSDDCTTPPPGPTRTLRAGTTVEIACL